MNLRTFLTDDMIRALIKIYIFVAIEVLCYSIYGIISSITETYVWTLEAQITSGLAGQIIQILNLIVMIDGIAIFIYVVIFIILAIKG